MLSIVIRRIYERCMLVVYVEYAAFTREYNAGNDGLPRHFFFFTTRG